MQFTQEIWKDILGYEGLYEVSNMGRVRSVDKVRRIGKHNRVIAGRILKLKKSHYPQIELYNSEGVSKMHLVHRLVAIAFIPNPDNKGTVNHKDFDRENNSVDNLEWNTQKENGAHSLAAGRKTLPTLGQHYLARKVINTETNEVFECIKLAAESCGVKLPTFSWRLRHGKSHFQYYGGL